MKYDAHMDVFMYHDTYLILCNNLFKNKLQGSEPLFFDTLLKDRPTYIQLCRLLTLMLSQCYLDEGSNLRMLYFEKYPMTGEPTKLLAEFLSHNKEITRFALTHSFMREFELRRIIGAMSHSIKFIALNFSGNILRDELLFRLSRIVYQSEQMLYLHLAYCGITNTGLNQMLNGNLHLCVNLREITLACNNLDDGATNSIRRLLLKDGLSKINLAENHLGGYFLETLGDILVDSDCSVLEIDLSRNNFTLVDLIQFEERFQECHRVIALYIELKDDFSLTSEESSLYKDCLDKIDKVLYRNSTEAQQQLMTLSGATTPIVYGSEEYEDEHRMQMVI